MDLLSDVLQTLRLSGALFLRGDFTAPWGVMASGAAEVGAFLKAGRGRVLVFHMVAAGQCHVRLDNGSAALVEAPGVILLPHGHSHALADRHDRAPLPVDEVLPPLPWTSFPHVVHGGGGAASRLICGYLLVSNVVFVPLLRDLPDLLAFRFSEDERDAGLRSVLDLAAREAEAARPGTASLVFRVAELFFVEVLRHYAAGLAPGDCGWLAATRDPAIARALQALHGEPARAWTVEDLARASAVSRSTLAGRFKQHFGFGPMQYLSKWRVQLAAARLAASDLAIAEAAAAVGYESESAFYRAFKREMGLSPKAWRLQEAAPRPIAPSV